MISTVYISQATGEPSEDDLFDLLEQCRRNNVKNGLTGMLMYGGGTYLQCLEGESADVDELLKKIYADPRHTAVKIIRRVSITSRQFTDWSMGFEHVTEKSFADTAGLSHLGLGAYSPEYLESNPEMIDTLLRWSARSKV